jgi:beta-galactosidase/beta-glucuronidase
MRQKRLIFAFCVVLLLGNIATIFANETEIFLREDWLVKSAYLVREEGAVISSAPYKPSGFAKTHIPTTVLAALVRNGMYPDPYVGLNNMKIPDASEEFNRAYGLAGFSHLPDGRNPWRDPYWFWKQFPLPDEYSGKVIWLNLEGINYRADIWLNGYLIADSKEIVGMFGRWALDITDSAKAGAVNTLAIEIHPLDYPGLPAEPQLRAFGPFGPNGGPTGDIGKNVTMQSSVGWDWIPAVRDRNMGIWQDVSVSATGSVDIRHPHVITDLPLPKLDKAHLAISTEVVNLSESPKKGVLVVRISPKTFNGQTIVLHKNVKLGPSQRISVHWDKDEYEGLSLDNPKLWWPNGYGPQNLYEMEVSFEVEGEISDTERCVFGIREVGSEVTEVEGWLRRDFFVNGQKILIKGGAWVPDMMLNRNTKKLFHELRLSKEANLNMVRIWGGGVTPPKEFFQICDELGLLVWHDFWITGDCQATWDKGSKDYPFDGDVFLNNATDVVKKLRNHPSLLVWTAGNEGYPREKIYVPLRNDILAKLDGTRPFLPSSGYTEPPDEWGLSWPDNTKTGSYSGGPYHWVDPREYFKKVGEGKDWLFKNEVGLPSFPHWESVKKFIEDLVPDPEVAFPLNHTYGYHDACEGNGKYSLYDQAIRDRYGEPLDLEDYAQKAQLVNAESYRAIFEAVNSRMDRTAGVLLWKTNPAWPSVIWQLYDWYLRPNAGYYFMKKANESIHIQLNLDDLTVSVANNTFEPQNDLSATADVYTLDMKEVWEAKASVKIDSGSSCEVFQVEIPENFSDTMCFLDLQLKDSEENCISENLYWLAAKNNFTAIKKLPDVNLDVSVTAKKNGENKICRIRMVNNSDALAFFVNPSIRSGKEGDEVLPSFWSDNYFSILPDGSKEATVEFYAPPLNGEEFYLKLEGWNIPPKLIKLDWS